MDKLPREKQIDLLAYHRITHSTDPQRAILSQPATYHDLLCSLLMARGKDPAKLTQSEPRRRAPGRGRAAPVTVHGGRSTPQMEAMADQWHSANMAKDWAKRTGSDPEAIAWLMRSD